MIQEIRSSKKQKAIKSCVVISFLMMITMNGLANILPINGVNSGEVSDSYFNLFAPSGFTFAIWSVIYIGLAGFTLYQTGILLPKNPLIRPEKLYLIGYYFTLSSIANTFWILSWHYKIIFLSFILISLILVCLIFIHLIMKPLAFTVKESFFIKLPFHLYFGWITVATIANITTLLVSLKWNGFGIDPVIWTCIVLVVGVIIGLITFIYFRSTTYGYVFLWAYWGILSKHLDPKQFNRKYPPIINTVAICLIVLLLGIAFTLFLKIKAKKSLHN